MVQWFLDRCQEVLVWSDGLLHQVDSCQVLVWSDGLLTVFRSSYGPMAFWILLTVVRMCWYVAMDC